MTEDVAVFTDTYLPTVNGVTYTIKTWRDHWERRGGTMPVVYPGSSAYTPDADEFPVRSVPFPFYDGYRVAVPRVPPDVDVPDVVHAHTPFGVGLAGRRFAKQADVPLVASYHTPVQEYTNYLSSSPTVSRVLRRLAFRYEQWFYERADVAITPSEISRDALLDGGLSTRVEVVPNGVDTDVFRPRVNTTVLDTHGINTDHPVVGYTGRHGYEKNLDELLAAVDGLDVTVVIAGDGPAREHLEALARTIDADVHFLGFLDRDDLAEFYTAIDVFAFPSPVETQGLVALEAIASGTPVVGVNAGALADTITDDVTGYRYTPGDIDGFRSELNRAIENQDVLAAGCRDARDTIGVEAAIDELATVYNSL